IGAARIRIRRGASGECEQHDETAHDGAPLEQLGGRIAHGCNRLESRPARCAIGGPPRNRPAAMQLAVCTLSTIARVRASRCALAIALAACGRKGVETRAHGVEVSIVVADRDRTAAELETAVATPIEHALADLPKLVHIHTRITPGTATV